MNHPTDGEFRKGKRIVLSLSSWRIPPFCTLLISTLLPWVPNHSRNSLEGILNSFLRIDLYIYTFRNRISPLPFGTFVSFRESLFTSHSVTTLDLQLFEIIVLLYPSSADTSYASYPSNREIKCSEVLHKSMMTRVSVDTFSL